MFKVRIINRHSDRWNQTGIVEEKIWESESLGNYVVDSRDRQRRHCGN